MNTYARQEKKPEFFNIFERSEHFEKIHLQAWANLIHRAQFFGA